MKCPTCNGIGAQAGAHIERIEPCPTCNGSAAVPRHAWIDGHGKVHRTKKPESVRGDTKK